MSSDRYNNGDEVRNSNEPIRKQLGRYLSVVPGSLLQFNDLPPLFKVLPVKLGMQIRPVAIVRL